MKVVVGLPWLVKKKQKKKTFYMHQLYRFIFLYLPQQTCVIQQRHSCSDKPEGTQKQFPYRK